MNKRQLQAIIDYFSRAIVACGLMMWGVVNVATAVLTYFRSNAGTQTDIEPVNVAMETQNWPLSFLMVAIFGVLPFLIGAVVLQRLFRATAPTAQVADK